MAMILPLVVLAIILPERLIDASSYIRASLELFVTLFPVTEMLAQISEFPNTTRVIVASAWLLVPLHGFLLWKCNVVVIDLGIMYERRVGLLFMILVLVAIFLWGHYTLDVHSIVRGKSFVGILLREMSTSRVALALIVGVFMSGVSWFFVKIISWIWYVPYIYFNYRGNVNHGR